MRPLGSLIGYAGVSTAEQPDLQTNELTPAGGQKVLVDTCLGQWTTAPSSSGHWGSCGLGTRWGCGAWTVTCSGELAGF